MTSANNLLCITSYNCNGLANGRKRKEIFAWLRDKKKYGIFCLQETHSSPKDEPKWEKEWGGPIYFSHGLTNQRGVMILFENNIQFILHSIQKDSLGRWILLDLTIDKFRMGLLNIYGPNADDANFFENIFNALQQMTECGDHFILVGDYNTELNTTLDRAGHRTHNYHPQAHNTIMEMMSSLNLVDIWRLQNPDLIRYTWRRGNQASRIDYFLISFSLVSRVSRSLIADRLRSDHSSIGLHITISECQRGPGYWKLNQSLLNDNIFLAKTKELIKDYFLFNNGSADPLIVWDAFKCVFRGHAIKMASRKYKQYMSREKELIKELNDLNTQLDIAIDFNSELNTLLSEKQRELERLYQDRVNGIIYRTRAIWMERGEK